jgi:hypothetical protein
MLCITPVQRNIILFMLDRLRRSFAGIDRSRTQATELLIKVKDNKLAYIVVFLVL